MATGTGDTVTTRTLPRRTRALTTSRRSSSARAVAPSVSVVRSQHPSWVRSQLDSPDFFDPGEFSRPSGSATLPMDRRLYSPVSRALFAPLRFSGRPARVSSPPPLQRPLALPGGRRVASFSPHPAALFYDRPHQVGVCVQRGVRREVMFATGRAGGRHRAGRPGPYSSVRCK